MITHSYIIKKEVAKLRDYVLKMVENGNKTKIEMLNELRENRCNGIAFSHNEKSHESFMYITAEWLDFCQYKYEYINNISNLEDAHLFMQLLVIMGFTPTLHYKRHNETCAFKDNAYNMRYILRTWDLPCSFAGVDGMKWLVKLWSMSDKERERYFDDDLIAKDKVYKDINEY